MLESCKTPRLMMKALGICIVMVATACQPKQKPVMKLVAVSARPFDRGPSAVLADSNQNGPSYRVQIGAHIRPK